MNFRWHPAARPAGESIPDIDGHNNLETGLNTLRRLKLPQSGIIIMGSLAMVLAGVPNRQANDADIIVPNESYIEFLQKRQLPNGTLLTPEAPGKSSISVEQEEITRLSYAEGRILPVEFFPASSYYPGEEWDQVLASMDTSHGFYHEPLDVIATHKRLHPHNRKPKADRDARDIQRIQHHLAATQSVVLR